MAIATSKILLRIISVPAKTSTRTIGAIQRFGNTLGRASHGVATNPSPLVAI